MAEVEELFTHYYTQNVWGNAESVSGYGSTMWSTENIRARIPELIAKYNIQSMLDAPCGDYHWMQHVPLAIQYIGADIVEPMIAVNNEKYQSDRTKFVKLNIISDPLPDVDMMLCRDVLIHFSNEDLLKFRDNFRRSNIKYLLTTNCGIVETPDMETGQFRKLCVYAPPLSFGLPLEVIPEPNWEGFPPKTLVLFNRDSI